MKKIAFIFILFIVATVQSYSQTTDDVLNLLIQKGSIKQEEADSLRADYALKQQDAKAKQKLFPLTTSKLFQLSGYTQIRYQSFQKFGLPDGFDIRKARLDLQGSVSPTWDYRIQVDFGGSAPKLLDAYAVYKPFEFLKVTAGQFSLPFSLENVAADKTLETIDRSQVVNALVARKGDVSNNLVDSIGDQSGRDVGFQLSGGVVKLKDRNLFDYYIGLFNGSGINATDVNEQKDVSSRLVFHPLKTLDIGGSYYNGKDRFTGSPKVDQNRLRWGAELAFNFKQLSIRSEFIRGQEKNSAPIIHQGWYAQAAYFVLPKKVQLVFKYDTYDPNIDVKKDANTYYIFGVNYLFNNNAKFQLNYSLRTEEGPKVINDLISAQLQLAF